MGRLRTWASTTTPSLERCRSVSMAWAPASTAPRKAAMVFSGKAALYPRWAMIWGMPLIEAGWVLAF